MFGPIVTRRTKTTNTVGERGREEVSQKLNWTNGTKVNKGEGGGRGAGEDVLKASKCPRVEGSKGPKGRRG